MYNPFAQAFKKAASKEASAFKEASAKEAGVKENRGNSKKTK
jgi:hypothetical protein